MRPFPSPRQGPLPRQSAPKLVPVLYNSCSQNLVAKRLRTVQSIVRAMQRHLGTGAGAKLEQ